ncbi:hypothetical protein MRX96_049186 [Rhipicephalus microplus]
MSSTEVLGLHSRRAAGDASATSPGGLAGDRAASLSQGSACALHSCGAPVARSGVFLLSAARSLGPKSQNTLNVHFYCSAHAIRRNAAKLE